MFYIHHIQCISPQQTFPVADVNVLREPENQKLIAIEPAYDGIPKNALRRMGKAVRIAAGAAMPVMAKAGNVDGIVIGTANGGMEDSIIFLKQLVDFDEGMLAPGSFVQSTANATAAQISLASRNRNYNITHVHRGLAFETAMLDVMMQLKEHAENNYLLGSVDEISTYNYKLDYLDGWYKTDTVTTGNLYTLNTPGSIAGEGAVMFLANNDAAGAEACVKDMAMLHTPDVDNIKTSLQGFLEKNKVSANEISLFINGENGDTTLQPYYKVVESLLDENTPVARYKHACGEYPTASSFALWLACKVLNGFVIPEHMVKKNSYTPPFKTILIYNCHKGTQHSFMLVTK